MKTRYLSFLLTTLCTTALLAGCASGQIHQEAAGAHAHAQAGIDHYMADIQNQERSAAPVTTTRDGAIISNVPYVSTSAVQHDTTYPAVFARQVTVRPVPGESIGSLLTTIGTLAGASIHADSDVLAGSDALSGGLPPPTEGKDATITLPPGLMSGSGSSASFNPVALNYSGDLKGLLDKVAGDLDATWAYNATTNSIHIFRYETKVFTLATVPGDAKNSASVGDSEQSVKGQQGQTVRVTGAQAKTTFDGDLTVWKSVAEAVKQMLSKDGSMTASPSTGTIVVRDRFDRIAQVASYIHQINDRLSMSILVNVKVYRVSDADTDNRGINWNILYNTMGRMANRIGATISSVRAPVSGGSSIILSAPTTITGGTCDPTSGNVSGCSLWNGSQFFLDALSTLGKASVVTTASVYTTNNQPAPVKVVDDQGYLAQTTPLYTTGVGGGSTGVVGAGATLTPGTVETGFTLQILPSVQPDGHRMLLQMILSDSTLDSLQTISSGGASIQIPDVTARETMQRAWLDSGQTLVLVGFQQTQSNNATQTPFDKGTWFLGGNRNMQRAKTALVIVITPVVRSSDSTI